MNAQTQFPEAHTGETREMSYAEAIRDAMTIALDRDPTVILMGEDIGTYGGAFQVTLDLIDKYGPERIMDTPISELGGAGVAVGAALTGLKPIFEFQFSDFAALAMEQIVNQAAKLRYMLGGEAAVPQGGHHAVIIAVTAGQLPAGCQHDARMEDVRPGQLHGGMIVTCTQSKSPRRADPRFCVMSRSRHRRPQPARC